jgi:hypothetical protein
MKKHNALTTLRLAAAMVRAGSTADHYWALCHVEFPNVDRGDLNTKCLQEPTATRRKALAKPYGSPEWFMHRVIQARRGQHCAMSRLNTLLASANAYIDCLGKIQRPRSGQRTS